MDGTDDLSSNDDAGGNFSAILLPHRSLSRKGFVIFMSLVCIVSFVAGVIFLMLGAWPVTGFFGLDALLIYVAFKLNYRDARLYEKIELDGAELKLARVHPSGRVQKWSFNPYWVRLELEESETGGDVISLHSHGQKLIFGSFLSDGEKRDFARIFRQALAENRGGAA